MALEFTPVKPCEWHGRYGRIPGKLSVLHVGYSNRLGKFWPYVLMETEQDRGTCWAVQSRMVDQVVKAVQGGKRLFGFKGLYGSFLINEFGQVLVPASDGGGHCAYVGIVQGRLQFENPFEAKAIFDLSDDRGLRCGAMWTRPYVGSRYNWSYQHGIHFRQEDDDRRFNMICPHQDPALIDALRQVRNEGYMRFIVNPHGLVLTKKNVGQNWKAVYVARLDYKRWFPREE